MFYLAAKYASDEKAERAIKTVEKIAKGVAFLNEDFHEVRHQEGISPSEKSLFLNFIAGGLKRNSKREMCVAEKLRTKIDAEPYLEKKEEIGGFPDLADLLPNDPLDVDVSLNDVVHTLPDMTFQFMLSQHGCKVLLSDYVWHHTTMGSAGRKDQGAGGA